MFYYNIYLIKKIKLLSKYFKTCYGNRRNKSPSDGRGDYNNYLLRQFIKKHWNDYGDWKTDFERSSNNFIGIINL